MGPAASARRSISQAIPQPSGCIYLLYSMYVCTLGDERLKYVPRDGSRTVPGKAVQDTSLWPRQLGCPCSMIIVLDMFVGDNDSRIRDEDPFCVCVLIGSIRSKLSVVLFSSSLSTGLREKKTQGGRRGYCNAGDGWLRTRRGPIAPTLI